MNETPHASSKLTAIAGTLAVLLIVLVALFILRDRMRAEIRESTREQTIAQEKLSTQLDTLKRSVDDLARAEKPSDESLASMDTKMADVNNTVAALSRRLEAMEIKTSEGKSEPLPVATPPAAALPIAPNVVTAPTSTFTTLALVALSGKPYAAQLDAWEKAAAPDAKKSAILRAFAQSGIPSESEILRQCRNALDNRATEPATVDDVSMVGKINTHLAGLVSIKKSDPLTNDAYGTVRTALERADIARVIEAIERLDEPSRVPLDAWLKTAKARAEVLGVLSTANAESSL